MSYINNWIISITTAAFFIIAIEMILPNNSIKKYVSFVLGLILIIIIMDPIIKLFNNGFDFTRYLTESTKYVENNSNCNTYDEYKMKNINDTLKIFKINIENGCIEKLKELNPKYNYEVSAEVKYDAIQNMVDIAKIKIGVQISSIKEIKEVEINDNSKDDKENILNNSLSKSIKECLSNHLNISEDNIIVYKL